MKKAQRVLGVLIASALTTTTAYATNGYFAHGYGTANKGLAGGGVALPQDAMAAATNPAGMVHVGSRLDVGAAIFSPLRSYTAEMPTGADGFLPGSGSGLGFANGSGVAGQEVDSDRDLYLVPSFGYNRMLDDKSSVGIAVYGNGGMNTFYPASGTAGGGGTFNNPATLAAGTAGVDLMQLFVAPTYARKINNKVSVGISALIAYQRFEAYGLADYGPLSNDPTNLTENGYDDSFGLGARVGILAQVSDRVTLGASYQSRVYMEEFDNYSGLFAEQGDFDIPSNFTIGLAMKATDKTTITFDIQHIMYSEVDSISNPIVPAIQTCATRGTPTDPSCLGGANGIGFGWDDMTIFKLGVQHQYSPTLVLRGGVSYGESPIAPSEVVFNILAPAVIETHITGGFTKSLDRSSAFSMAFMYAPSNSVAGNPTGQQDIELEMYQWEVEASYSMSWN